MFTWSSQLFLIITLTACVFTSVNAATVDVFDVRTDWETAVGSFQEENFNALPDTDPIPHNTVLDVGLFNIIYTSADNSIETANQVLGPPDGGTINGTREVRLRFDNVGPDNTTLLELRFNLPIFAFGATWNDIAGGSAEPTINVVGATIQLNDFLGNGVVPEVANGIGDRGFLGFTSDMSFNSLTFTASGIGDSFRFDDVVLSASPVPIPSAMFLMSTGLLGLLGWQRWRTKSN